MRLFGLRRLRAHSHTDHRVAHHYREPYDNLDANYWADAFDGSDALTHSEPDAFPSHRTNVCSVSTGNHEFRSCRRCHAEY